MSDPSRVEIVLTDDLIDYIRRSTIQIASRSLSPRGDVDDVVQHVLLYFVSRPPKYDPQRGASLKSLVYLIVQRQVWKYLKQHREKLVLEDGYDIASHEARPKPSEASFDRPSFLDYIDCESTRRMCLLMMEHKNNVSEVARRMNVAEGTIRYRLKLLEAKLRASGFKPFAEVD